MTTCPTDGAPVLPDEGADRTKLDPGTMVGEYRVDALLGSGAFGDVYAGEQPLIGKRVAIKVLSARFSSEPQMVSRFIAEARAVNRVRHRNIIDIFSFGTLPSRRHYFVMELLSGVVLSRLLERDGSLSPERALPILRGVAGALDAAHKAGIAHRDLKPDNVFIAEEEGGKAFPKLLDFGVAKLLDETSPTHKTATGAPIGTPAYMSPEQCRGGAMDHRSDIYAFGVLTHRVLTGSLPFDAKVTMDLMVQHTSEPPPPMSSVRADLPAALDAPVLSMLAKDPAARPQEMSEAWNALAAAMTAAGVIDAASGATALLPRSSEISLDPSSGEVLAETLLADPSSPGRSGADGAAAKSNEPNEPGSTLGGVLSVRGPPGSSARPRRKRAVIVAAIAVSGAAALTALVFNSNKPEGPKDLSSPRSSSVVNAAPPAAEVRLRVLSSLPDVEVSLDGRTIGRAGESITIPKGTGPITLELKKGGYQPKRYTVVPDSDMTIPVDLEPEVGPAPSALVTTARAAAIAPPSPSSAPIVGRARTSAGAPGAPSGSSPAAAAKPPAGQLREVDTPDEFRSP